METDHASPVEANTADAEPTAYISPVADSILLMILTAAVSLAGAAVILP